MPKHNEKQVDSRSSSANIEDSINIEDEEFQWASQLDEQSVGGGRDREQDAMHLVTRFTRQFGQFPLHSSVLGHLLNFHHQQDVGYGERRGRKRQKSHRGRKTSSFAVYRRKAELRKKHTEMNAWMMAQAAIAASAACSPAPSARNSLDGVVSDIHRPKAPWVHFSCPVSDASGYSSPGMHDRAASWKLNPVDQLLVATAIADILQKQDYMLLLAKAMVMFGAPSHRLDRNLFQASKRLGLEAQFSHFPGFTIISFGDTETHTSETKILRVGSGYALSQLQRADGVARAVAMHEISVSEGTTALEQLVSEEAKDKWSRRWQLVGWFLSSFSAAPLAFNGGWAEAGVAGALGLMIGCMSFLAKKLNAYADLFEITAAMVAAFLASALQAYVCFWPTVLGAIVILLPGLSITKALMELASRNMVSGAVGMVSALVNAFVLGFGMNIGHTLWRSAGTKADAQGQDIANVFSQNVSQCVSISPYWNMLFFPVMMISFALVLQASPRQFPAIFAVSSIGFLVTVFANEPFWSPPPMITPALAAFAIGVSGNVYARITDHLAVVTVIPSVLMLVPGVHVLSFSLYPFLGSLGVKGVMSLIATSHQKVDGVLSESMHGIGFVFQMMYISLGITIGLFVAALIVMPLGRRKRSEMMVV